MLNPQKPQSKKSNRYLEKVADKRKDVPKPLQAMPNLKREIFFNPYQRRIFA